MREIFLMLLLGILINGCGPSEPTQFSCINGCTVTQIKESNKCTLEHKDDFMGDAKCNNDVSNRYHTCMGGCMGSL